jgi:hypothetical protein
MAKISQGILGGFSGTVGTVVGGHWRGIDYMRQSLHGSGNCFIITVHCKRHSFKGLEFLFTSLLFLQRAFY